MNAPRCTADACRQSRQPCPCPLACHTPAPEPRRSAWSPAANVALILIVFGACAVASWLLIGWQHAQPGGRMPGLALLLILLGPLLAAGAVHLLLRLLGAAGQ